MAEHLSQQHQNPVQKKEEQEGGHSMTPPQFKLAAGGADGGDGVSQLKTGNTADGGGDGGDGGGVPKEVIDHLKLREGWREVVYLDSLGLPTVGLGHLLTAEQKKTYKVGDRVPVPTLEAWAQADAKKAYDAAKSQASTLGVSSQPFINALASVNFQLGTAWNGIHKKTWGYMVAHQWEKAALEVQDSTWNKQTPVRVQDFQAALRALAAGGGATTTQPGPGPQHAPPATPGSTGYEFKIGAPTGTGTVTAQALNVRSGPGTNYGKVGAQLAKGDAVTIYGQTNGWLCIGNGKWVSGEFVQVTPKATHGPAGPVTPPKPKETGPDLKSIAQNVYDAMFATGFFVGTDEEKVYSNLSKLNHDPKLIERFMDTYKALFKRDVVADIRSEFSDNYVMFGGLELTKALGYLKVAAAPVTPPKTTTPPSTPATPPAPKPATPAAPTTQAPTTTPTTQGPATTPKGSEPEKKLSSFSLSGSVGKTIAGSKGKVPADNIAKDVKLVQNFLATTGYMDANNPEIVAVAATAKATPTAKIAEADLANTIAAIMEWQKKGATGNAGTPDGQMSKGGATARSMKVLNNVYNKYGGEKPLEEEKMVMTASQWHSQARFGFNYRGGDEAKETAYKQFVKAETGIEDPADLFNATKDQIAKIKSDSRFNSVPFIDNAEIRIHGIREGDKNAHPKPNWICCFDAAKKMLGHTGATAMGPEDKIQTFMESGHAGGKFTPQASIGFHYIDGQIRNGKAVFVGVDKISSDTHNYNEGVTDHFICIVGKGRDAKGWYFRYFDPGTSIKANGVSAENKLYIGADYQSLKGGNYNVSQIRVNEEKGI